MSARAARVRLYERELELRRLEREERRKQGQRAVASRIRLGVASDADLARAGLRGYFGKLDK